MSRRSTSWEALRTDPRLMRLRALHLQAMTLSKKVPGALESEVLRDAQWIDRVLDRVSSTYTVFVMGQVSSGKSSLINALIGRRLLVPSSDPTDGVVSVLLPARDGVERAERVGRDGRVVPFANLQAGLAFLRQQDTAARDQLQCHEVRLFVDAPVLNLFRIVNTPGLGDRLAAFEQTALRYLAEDESDLVLWTFHPDNAANAQEIDLFAAALSRRRKAVLGVITNCLPTGRSEDYDPRADPELDAVERQLHRHLGTYLRSLIRFDSHVARELAEKLDRDPSVASRPNFQRAWERCGRAELDRALEEILPGGSASVESARVESVLSRCAGTAHELARCVDSVATASATKHAEVEAQLAALERLQRDFLDPARKRTRQALREVARERAGEMVKVMGDAAASAMATHFGLFETLWRGLGSKVRLTHSMGQRLSTVIQHAVEESLRQSRALERTQREASEVLAEQLRELGSSLAQRPGVPDVSPHHPGSTVDADDVLIQSVLGSLKNGAIGAVERRLTAMVSEGAAVKASQTAASGAGQQAATQTVAAGAGQQAAAQGARAAAGTAVGAILLVLTVLELKKLFAEFRKGRDAAAKAVRQEYLASVGVQELRLFDALWEGTRPIFDQVVAEAMAPVGQRRTEVAQWVETRHAASRTAQELRELAAELA